MTSIEFIAQTNTGIIASVAGLVVGYLIVISIFSALRKALP